MMPGDACRLIGGGLVEHAANCADYLPGTITNTATGKVERHRPAKSIENWQASRRSPSAAD